MTVSSEITRSVSERTELIAIGTVILTIVVLVVFLVAQINASHEKFKTVSETINITVSDRHSSSFPLSSSFVVTEDDKIYSLEYENCKSLFFKLKPHTEHTVRINRYISDEMKNQPATIIEVL